ARLSKGGGQPPPEGSQSARSTSGCPRPGRVHQACSCEHGARALVWGQLGQLSRDLAQALGSFRSLAHTTVKASSETARRAQQPLIRECSNDAAVPLPAWCSALSAPVSRMVTHRRWLRPTRSLPHRGGDDRVFAR